VALVVTCPCGETIRAETEDELVKQATKHAKEVHNQNPTREQLLAMAKPE
jgi:predicted small metal-binding protein